MARRIVLLPEAEEHLASIYTYIAKSSSPAVASRFVNDITDHCGQLADFPELGRSRDDLKTGMRTLGFRKRVLIAYLVAPDAVIIIGVFYGGQDFEPRFGDED